jgi:hypothetical protein
MLRPNDSYICLIHQIIMETKREQFGPVMNAWLELKTDYYHEQKAPKSLEVLDEMLMRYYQEKDHRLLREVISKLFNLDDVQAESLKMLEHSPFVRNMAVTVLSHCFSFAENNNSLWRNLQPLLTLDYENDCATIGALHIIEMLCRKETFIPLGIEINKEVRTALTLLMRCHHLWNIRNTALATLLQTTDNSPLVGGWLTDAFLDENYCVRCYAIELACTRKSPHITLLRLLYRGLVDKHWMVQDCTFTWLREKEVQKKVTHLLSQHPDWQKRFVQTLDNITALSENQEHVRSAQELKRVLG